MSQSAEIPGDYSGILAEFDERPQGARVTRRELAGLIGVHMQTITKWEREGMPIAMRGDRGTPSEYVEADVRAWLEARAKQREDLGPGADLPQVRARKEHWQAQIAEQTFKVRSGKLIPVEEVERAWSSEVVAVRTKLLSLPQTLADKLFRAATLEGLSGVEKALDAAVRDVLNELAGERQS